jgi:replication factor A1
MSGVRDVFDELSPEIPFSEFEELVENKVDEMNGLVDEHAAAILVSQDFDQGKVESIENLTTAMDSAEFTAKVTSVGQLRTFEREDEDGESSQGQVCNVEVGDETGHVTLALWDGMAKAAAQNLEAGEVLEIKGYPKDGYRGLEVSVKDIERVSDDGIDIRTFDTYQIDDLHTDLSGIDVTGLLLDTTPLKTFDRDDGSTGQVANLILGDETGRIQVALWDDKAEVVDNFEVSEAVKVSNVNVRERDGKLELHAGSWSTVEEVDEIIEYRPNTTDIKNIDDGVVTIAGTVADAYDKDSFTRDDGSEGSVRNIVVEDDTGSLRVALWGDKADKDIEQGDELLLADISIQEGFEGGTEGSANWNSSITIIRKAADVPKRETEAPTEENSQATGLNEYDGDESTADGRDGDGDTDQSGETIEVTGTILGTGDTATLEANDEQHTVVTDEDLRLGQQVTVRGAVKDGQLHAEEIF